MRQEKQLLLAEIQDQISSASGWIATSYSELRPNLSWELRSELGARGAQLEVVKKRLFVKTLGAEAPKEAAHLEGNIALTLVRDADPIEAAKVILRFSKENGELFKVLFGRVDGAIVMGSEIELLSKLPSMDVMRGEFLSVLAAPMSHVLSVFEAKCSSEQETGKQSS